MQSEKILAFFFLFSPVPASQISFQENQCLKLGAVVAVASFLLGLLAALILQKAERR
jgi:hypothetical protein